MVYSSMFIPVHLEIEKETTKLKLIPTLIFSCFGIGNKGVVLQNIMVLCLRWHTCSHSSPAMGWVGLGNQPERLATSLAAPMEPWMSLMDDAEIWESGSSPDNMPCSSEQGASEDTDTQERE